MLVLVISTFLFISLVVIIIFKPVVTGLKRRWIMAQPFPVEWEAIICDKVIIYRHLPASLKDQLKKYVMVFLDEKRFEGCDGLEITDEIRVTIAAEACILLLNRQPHFYPDLTTVLVYRHSYFAGSQRPVGHVYIETTEERAGESWLRGEVVLAWDCVSAGQHVVMHEFAHQLDQEDGLVDGSPALGLPSRYAAWAHVLGDEYEKLRDDIERDGSHVLDEYGATNPAEFFAVATEAFFNQPHELKASHPALYAQLSGFYRVDPGEWLSCPTATHVA